MGKLFGTDGVRDRANQGNMTVETAIKLGRAVAIKFKNEHDPEQWPAIVIGRDPRLSGAMLESALAAGVCSAGVDAHLLGIVPTPAVAAIAVQTGAVAGLMVSASHNPYFDNGIKVFKGDGFKLSDAEEAEIEALFFSEQKELPVDDGVGAVFQLGNSTQIYSEFCLDTIEAEQPFSGLKLVLDCSNGATSDCAEKIFSELGADVTVIHDQPDGLNINENCGSQHTEMLQRKVRKLQAHAGLAFDGDGDRLIAVDEKGTELTGDQIMAICARSYKKTNDLKNNIVVATVMSNMGFHAAMKANGIKTESAGVGDRKVLELMKKKGAVLGGEDSGHMIFLDCHTTGDGIVSGIKLVQTLKQSGKKLSELAGIMTPFPQQLINVDVQQKPDIRDVPALEKAITAAEAELGDEGRVLIRYSGTQPMCRVMVEGPTEEQTRTIAEKLADVVKSELG
ncbi:phosphoglucosamine mutase [Pontiella agarivorans]|uniref:Phosphoglucosamine mutase n=1 Tax=Pontiella agarivorans TaxID=3038953 RepID=A0ABU5MTP7_9BACT|nr:phosphoglucosamine mutase [Pontiella agarivorans]MDZ8117599.1 phosphoglucosamine mutase [Pontiella agarivorans]